MIRINLIPVSGFKKTETLLIQSVVGFVVLAVVAIGCYLIGIQKKNDIVFLQEEIAIKQRSIEELRQKVGEVEKYKAKQKSLEDQINVIKSLQNRRTGPVRMMDELSSITPKRLWISSFKETSKKGTINGLAAGGEEIAEFMELLKTSKHFMNPELTTVQAGEEQGASIQKFNITVDVRYEL